MTITSRAVLLTAVTLVFACGGGDDPTGPTSTSDGPSKSILANTAALPGPSGPSDTC